MSRMSWTSRLTASAQERHARTSHSCNAIARLGYALAIALFGIHILTATADEGYSVARSEGGLASERQVRFAAPILSMRTHYVN